MKQIRIPATYMRGGTSKGVFFLAEDLPVDQAARDRLLLRIVGSPDRFGKHIDGMGGATSSTSKVVVVARSTRPDCDVDYWFGAVAIEAPVIDWSGNCGNLTAAVGPFAIAAGLVDAPTDAVATVRLWQAAIERRIDAHVPMRDGEVLEAGDFELDGVAFPGAEVRLEFVDPASAEGDGGSALFPTGRRVEMLEVPEIGRIEATLIDAGNPTVFVEAAALGLRGTELQPDVNGDAALLARAEAIRAHAAVAMRLAQSPEHASASRPATPKLAFVAPPADYVASDGRRVAAESIDLLARIFSMGPLHHAMTGTGSVAIAAAAAVPGTLVHRIAPIGGDGLVRFGHPSGRLAVGAIARPDAGAPGGWAIRKVIMSRSARTLMEGWVRVPAY